MLGLDTTDAVSFAFGLFNLLRLASYLPQIVAVARDHHGARAISLTCWTIWIGANATTALYAWVHLADVALASISAFNTSVLPGGLLHCNLQARCLLSFSDVQHLDRLNTVDGTRSVCCTATFNSNRTRRTQ